MALTYDYYPAVTIAIDHFGQGQTITKACDLAGIHYSTFRSYLKADPVLAQMYEDAERRGMDAMADALVNIDNHRIHGQSDARMAKVVSDNIRWVLARRDPQRFGDRVQVDHSVSLDVTITTALDAARRRVGSAALPVEDAEVLEPLPADDLDALLL